MLSLVVTVFVTLRLNCATVLSPLMSLQLLMPEAREDWTPVMATAAHAGWLSQADRQSEPLLIGPSEEEVPTPAAVSFQKV